MGNHVSLKYKKTKIVGYLGDSPSNIEYTPVGVTLNQGNNENKAYRKMFLRVRKSLLRIMKRDPRMLLPTVRTWETRRQLMAHTIITQEMERNDNDKFFN